MSDTDVPLRWFLRSMRDADTHRGKLELSLCGATFIPRPTCKVVGEAPGHLVDGPLALHGSLSDRPLHKARRSAAPMPPPVPPRPVLPDSAW